MPLEINKLDFAIGKKIKILRKKHNMGLKILAHKINISLQQLYKYENATNKISASLLYKISNVFNIKIESFFSEFEEIEKPPSKDNIGFNILLVDDYIRDECIIKNAVTSFPAKINLYSVHGYEFMDFLKNTQDSYIKPDLILLELHLLKTDGISLLKEFKRNKRFSAIPVIIITDSNNKNEINLSYNLQVSGLIIKSCSFVEFKKQIKNVLSYWFRLVQLPEI